MKDPGEPRYPTIAALALLSAWVAVLAFPMLQGQWLASPYGDQYAVGYGFRAWGAAQWHALGHVPLWNPMLFGGLPFVAAGHGDIFYPTSFLRLAMPVATAMNLGFVIHYIAAGGFTYLFLRRLRVSWGGAVVGGLAYQLTGLLISYASPGHDGKLFASAALPLACLGLVMALRERRVAGYPVLAIAVALALLGHVQLAYYLLIATGLFALYLTFGEPSDESLLRRVSRLAGAAGAVVVGFGLSMIQIWPFLHFIPFGPRAVSYGGYEAATSWAVPWDHVPGFFLAGFVGDTPHQTYWGSNFAKLHSEYLGLPVVALAVLGAADRGRRRFVWWFGGIGILFLLVSLAGATPFYRLWYAVMPMVKKTRAAGMAFYIPSFAVAVFAALGVARLERGEGQRAPRIWLALGAAVALLALAGVFSELASSMAAGLEAGRQGAESVARAAASSIRWGAFWSGLALALAGGLAWVVRGRSGTPPLVLTLGLAAIVSTDLWRDGRGFWTYSPPPQSIHAADDVTRRLNQTPLPYRALDLGVYPGDGVPLITHDIPLLLGHSGNELHRFDELMGGRGQWTNVIEHPDRTLDLFAVRFVIAPPTVGGLPGYRAVLTGATTSSGTPATLFERAEPAPYARVVAAAIKTSDEDIIPTLMNPRLPLDRVLLLGPDAPVQPEILTALPSPSSTEATITAWRPGEMTIALAPAPPEPSYLLVAENWYPEWEATVDGHPAQVLRGDYTMLTVALPAGARSVQLAFRSGTFRTGERLTEISLVLVAAAFVAAVVAQRRRRA
jgi:hypothetical protein